MLNCKEYIFPKNPGGEILCHLKCFFIEDNGKEVVGNKAVEIRPETETKGRVFDFASKSLLIPKKTFWQKLRFWG